MKHSPRSIDRPADPPWRIVTLSRGRTLERLSAARSPWRRSRLPFAVAALVFGVINAIALLGINALDPTHLEWLKGDPATAYLGWAFLRQDPQWHFPPTFTTRLGYPLGVSISLMDSIPLLAVLLRPFSPILPEPFQYLGLYVLMTMVLQAWFGFRLCHLLCDGNIVFTTLGGLLLLLAPAITWRIFGHFALASHWLILAALVGYFRQTPWTSPAGRMWPLWLVVALSGPINAYVGLLCLLIAFAATLRLVLERRCTVAGGLGLSLVAAVLYSLPLVVFGVVTSGKVWDYSGGGYGFYSMNLLALVNPMEFRSIALPPLPVATAGQYEGYSYLGIGVIILLILGLARRPGIVAQLREPALLPLFGLALLCVALAASSTVTVGSVTLVDLPVPGVIRGLLGIFRSTGRFVWPTHYLLILAAIVLTYRMWRPPLGAVLLGCALLAQVADLASLRRAVHAEISAPVTSPLVSPIWRSLGATHAKLMVIPPWQCTGSGGTTSGGADGYAIFGALAVEQRMALNSYYAGRTAADAIKLHCDEIPAQVRQGLLDADAAYVVDTATLIALGMAGTTSHRCQPVDGFILCTHNPSGGGLGMDWVEQVPVLGAGMEVGTGAGPATLRIAGNLAEADALVWGWHSIEPGGAWTGQPSARLVFRITAEAARRFARVRLRLAALVAEGGQGYRISSEGHTLAEGRLSMAPGGVMQPFEVVIPLRALPALAADWRGLVALDLETERMISPASLGRSRDSRKLGLMLVEIGLES